MKKKNNLVLWTVSILMGTFGLNACVDDFKVGDAFLEKAPNSTDLNEDSIFGKAEYVRYFLWDTYKYMYDAWDVDRTIWLNSGNIEALSDLIHSTIAWTVPERVYYAGTYNASWEDHGWIQSRYAYMDNGGAKDPGPHSNFTWTTIRKCWLLINNLDKEGTAPDMPEAERNRLKAEAKIIIASRYYDLFKNYGGLPIVDHALPSDEIYNQPRGTLYQTVGLMTRLLDEAISTTELPFALTEAENQNWAGRLTKGAAMALKAKVLLYAASPIFNDAEPYSTQEPQVAVEARQVWWGGRKDSLWQECKKACEAFFSANGGDGATTGAYHLVQPETKNEAGYRKAFYEAYHNRGNSESIIEVHHLFKLAEWDQFPGNVAHTGAYAPTLEWMELFDNADGTRWKGYEVYNTGNPNNIDIFENRDPRLYETLVVQHKGFIWQGKQVDITESGELRKGKIYDTRFSGNGLALYKWLLDYSNIGNDPVKWPYLRMADMLYTYAEALAETGDLAGACKQVNLVRARVGLGKIEECLKDENLTSNKENFIKELLRERGCEFGMEEGRFYDMVRRKMQDRFTKHLRWIKTYRKDDTSIALPDVAQYPSFRYEVGEIQDTRMWWEPGFWTNKWYLSAFPNEELNKDYGLTQNPGW